MKNAISKLMVGALAFSMFAIPSTAVFAAQSDSQSLTGQIDPGTRDITVLENISLGSSQVRNNLVLNGSTADSLQIHDFTGSQVGYTLNITLDNLDHSTEGSLMAEGFNLQIGQDAQVVSELDASVLHTQNTVNINSTVLTGDLFTMDYTNASQDELGRMASADTVMSLSLPLNKSVPGDITGQVTYSVVELD